MEARDKEMLRDVKRLMDAISTSLAPEEIAKIDPSVLAAVRSHVVAAAPKRRTIDPAWIREKSPFAMEEFEARVDKICGCGGKHDCDCVSVFNQASRELWYEHNTRAA